MTCFGSFGTGIPQSNDVRETAKSSKPGLMKLLIDRIFAIEKTDVIEKAYHMTKEIKINE